MKRLTHAFYAFVLPGQANRTRAPTAHTHYTTVATDAVEIKTTVRQDT